jgi:DnaJ-class molecular chaperone
MKYCKSCNGTGIFDDSGNPSEPCPDCMGSGYEIPEKFILDEDYNEEAFTMEYHCPECNETWFMNWSCACDDKCPVCNTAYTPLNVKKN